jgi:hypothetical protein
MKEYGSPFYETFAKQSIVGDLSEIPGPGNITCDFGAFLRNQFKESKLDSGVID